MRFVGLVPTSLFTLGLTLSVLPAVGWFAGQDRCSRFCPPRSQAQAQEVAQEIPSDVAARCRRAQPTHWRYLVLHR